MGNDFVKVMFRMKKYFTAKIIMFRLQAESIFRCRVGLAVVVWTTKVWSS